MGTSVGSGMGNPFALPALIGTGERNDTLFRYASSLQAKGLEDEEILELVSKANQDRCSESLGDQEVRGIVDGVTMRYPKGAPRATGAMGEKGATGAPSELATVEVNDKELSRLFARTYRAHLRWVPEARSWFAFDGTRWVGSGSGSEQIAQCLLKGFVDDLCRATFGIEDDDRKARRTKAVARYFQQPVRAKLLEDCKGELYASVAEFDGNPNLLNCRNGTLDLSGMAFKRHDPSDMLTDVAGCDYDPDASYGEWVGFLENTFEGDLELCGFFQQAIGAALAADTSDERFYIAYGPTRTGKSTTLETVLAMAGGYGCTIQPETLQEIRRSSRSASGDIARLRGVRIACCPEPPKGMVLDASLVKQLTGGDTVTARALFSGEISFRPCFQLWMNSNYLPEVRDTTLFESDRAVAVPFLRRVEPSQRDGGLKARMREPRFLSGVLNWALDGLRMRRAAPAGVPEACRELTREYASDSDRMGRFIVEMCETGNGLRADGARLYEAYAAWTEGEGCGQLSKTKLFKELKRRDGITDLGRGKVGGKDCRHVFGGIRLLPHI